MDNSAAHDIKQLITYCDDSVDNVGVENLPRLSALASLGFCNLIRSTLNDVQKDAVDEAMMFWSGRPAPRLDAFRADFLRAINADMQSNKIGGEERRNRLVWCALNANTQFDGVFCEYLILLGAELEIPVPEMASVFARVFKS
jgi:hypothetical protein